MDLLQWIQGFRRRSRCQGTTGHGCERAEEGGEFDAERAMSDGICFYEFKVAGCAMHILRRLLYILITTHTIRLVIELCLF
jgi:hypothetical protein